MIPYILFCTSSACQMYSSYLLLALSLLEKKKQGYSHLPSHCQKMSVLRQGGTTSPQSRGAFGPRIPVLAAAPSLSAAASTNHARLKLYSLTTPYLHACLLLCLLLVFCLSFTLCYLHSFKIHDCYNIQLLADPIHCFPSLRLSSPLLPFSITPLYLPNIFNVMHSVKSKGHRSCRTPGSPNRCQARI
jgi:hypothetical protein